MLWFTEPSAATCSVHGLTCHQAARARRCVRIHLELRQELLNSLPHVVGERRADYYILFLFIHGEPRTHWQLPVLLLQLEFFSGSCCNWDKMGVYRYLVRRRGMIYPIWYIKTSWA